MFKAAILEMVVFRHFPPKIWRDMGAHFQEHHLSYLKPSRNKSSMKMVTESWKMTQLTAGNPLTFLLMLFMLLVIKALSHTSMYSIRYHWVLIHIILSSEFRLKQYIMCLRTLIIPNKVH